MAKRTAALATALLAMALIVAASGTLGPSADGELLWAFESGVISEDGSQLTVEAFRPGDPNCHQYSHIETEQRSGELVVSLFYKHTGQKFCQIPCPLGATRSHSIELNPPLDPATPIIRHPDTAPHCSEDIANQEPLIVETTEQTATAETRNGRLIRRKGCLLLASNDSETALLFRPGKATRADRGRGIVFEGTEIQFKTRVTIEGQPTISDTLVDGSSCPTEALVVESLRTR